MAELIEIIYCFRDRDLKRVRHSLDSLALQTNKNFRVIFVNYGSNLKVTKEVEELLKKYSFCRYLYVNTEGRLWNRADALNQGFLVAEAPYVFTADIDLVFYDHFIERLHTHKNKEVVQFFPVGYLSEKNTSSLKAAELKDLPFIRSKDFALGMMLSSLEIIKTINGYNSFYCLWGQEDNDIKFRIEKAGIKTEFSKDLLMLHQYHQPVQDNDKFLPKGWLQLMKDYHRDYQESQRTFAGLSETIIPEKRPAQKLFQDENQEFNVIVGRKLFLRYKILEEIMSSASRSVFKYHIPSAHLPQSVSTRISGAVNKLLRGFKLPFNLKNPYQDQYISAAEIREEVYFLLHILKQYIDDYYVISTETELKLVIIKK